LQPRFANFAKPVRKVFRGHFQDADGVAKSCEGKMGTQASLRVSASPEFSRW
jgi:hypothetical protein